MGILGSRCSMFATFGSDLIHVLDASGCWKSFYKEAAINMFDQM